MKLNLDRKSDLPLYRQIANQIREYIRTGVLPPESRLPTVRQFALDLQLTRLTVQTAYAELQAEGLVESVVGRGTFVTNRPQLQPWSQSKSSPKNAGQPQIPWYSQSLLSDILRMSEQPNLISFAQAIPATESFPVGEFKKILSGLLKDPSVMAYGPTQGEISLREQVAHLLLERGVIFPPDQVLITAGAQQGIDLAMRAFTEPNEVVLVEEPTYPGVIELGVQRNQIMMPIPFNDGGGLCLEALETACKSYRPRLLYLIPSFHNPTGQCLTKEQSKELLRLARLHKFLIVEDDTYGFLGHTNQAPPALKCQDEDGEQVIFLTTFSKSLMPGLRLGAAIASPKNLMQMLAAKRSTDLNCATLMQRSLAEYLHRHQFGIHLNNVCKLYAERRLTMVQALSQHLPECEWKLADGGLSIWVKLPQQVEEREFYLDAIAQGVGVAPGAAFFVRPQRQAYMRLSYGAQTPAQIEKGIATLGKVLHHQLQQRSLLLSRLGRTKSLMV